MKSSFFAFRWGCAHEKQQATRNNGYIEIKKESRQSIDYLFWSFQSKWNQIYGLSITCQWNAMSRPLSSINLTKNYILCSNDSYNVGQHMILCHEIKPLQMSKARCAYFTTVWSARS